MTMNRPIELSAHVAAPSGHASAPFRSLLSQKGSPAPRRSRPGLRRFMLLGFLGLGVVLLGVWVLGRSSPGLAAKSASAIRTDGKNVVFPEEFAKSVALTTVEVGKKAILPAISVVGTVTFDPSHVARIGARLRGIVREVHEFEGATVKAGQPLASMDSPELGEAQAAVSTLDAENRAAQMHRARQLSLAEQKLTTSREVEESQAEAARSAALLSAAKQRVSSLGGRTDAANSRGLGVHHLTSPIDGTVIERHISKGQLLEANHAAYLVADLDHLWVELSVFEKNLPSVKVGDAVVLHAESAGAKADPVAGKVAQVGSVLNAQTRGALVRVEVDNRERKFRPGQSVSAVIRSESTASASTLSVPSGAVIYVDGAPSVLLSTGPRSVAVTRVTLGATNGQEVEIKSGLERGQRVIVQGTADIRNLLFR